MERKKGRFLFLSSFISTISLQVHPNGAIFSLSLLLMYISLFRKNVLSKSTTLLISGLFIGFVLWLFFNYHPYSTSSFQTVHNKYLPPFMNMHFLHFLKLSFLNVPWFFSIKYLQWLSLKYHSQFFVIITYATLFLMLVALLSGNSRKNLGFLLSFMVLPLFVSGFVTGGWNWYHHSVFLSISSIALAVAIIDISDVLPTERFKRLLPLIIIVIITLFGVWDIMKNNVNMMKYDYNAFMNRVSANIPEGATVLGAPLYYPAFIDSGKHFVSYLFLEERCPNFADEIKKLKIDYVLMDIDFKVSSTLWCSDQYFQTQIIDFLNTKPYLEIEANYPSRNRLMQAVYLFEIN